MSKTIKQGKTIWDERIDFALAMNNAGMAMFPIEQSAVAAQDRGDYEIHAPRIAFEIAYKTARDLRDLLSSCRYITKEDEVPMVINIMLNTYCGTYGTNFSESTLWLAEKHKGDSENSVALSLINLSQLLVGFIRELATSRGMDYEWATDNPTNEFALLFGRDMAKELPKHIDMSDGVASLIKSLMGDEADIITLSECVFLTDAPSKSEN